MTLSVLFEFGVLPMGLPLRCRLDILLWLVLDLIVWMVDPIKVHDSQVNDCSNRNDLFNLSISCLMIVHLVRGAILTTVTVCKLLRFNK